MQICQKLKISIFFLLYFLFLLQNTSASYLNTYTHLQPMWINVRSQRISLWVFKEISTQDPYHIMHTGPFLLVAFFSAYGPSQVRAGCYSSIPFTITILSLSSAYGPSQVRALVFFIILLFFFSKQKSTHKQEWQKITTKPMS